MTVFTAQELWQYDGATASMVADIYSGGTSSSPAGFTIYNGVLYFEATTSNYGTELMTFDGTYLSVIDLNPGLATSDPFGFTIFNNRLYFNAICLILWRGTGSAGQ